MFTSCQGLALSPSIFELFCILIASVVMSMFHYFSSFILKGLMFACSVCLVLLSLWCLVHLCQLCFPHYPSVSLCSVLGRLFVSCH